MNAHRRRDEHPAQPASTAQELGARVAVLGAAIDEWLDGADRGCLAVAMSSGEPLAAVLLAASRVAQSVLVLDPDLRTDEARSIAQRARCEAVLLDEATARVHGGWACEQGRSTRVEQLPRARAGAAHEVPLGFEADLVLHTSGSTGVSKIVVRSRAAVAAEVDGLRAKLALGPHDRVANLAPLHHAYGLVVGTLAPLAAGARVAQLAGTTAGGIERRIGEAGSTIVVGVPFHYELLVRRRQRDPQALRHARLLLAAGAPTPPQLASRFHRAFGARFAPLYGTTETGAISVDLTDAPATEPHGVGTPLPGLELSVEGDRDAPGEVRVRGPQILDRYLQAPPGCTGPDDEGWFRTGDRGYRLDGALWLAPRVQAPFNVAGRKVDPAPILAVLRSHPEVEDARVVAARSAFGETLLQAVVASRSGVGARELRTLCRDRLAAREVPARFRVLPELPRSATGKVLVKYLVEPESPAPTRPRRGRAS